MAWKAALGHDGWSVSMVLLSLSGQVNCFAVGQSPPQVVRMEAHHGAFPPEETSVVPLG